MRSFNLFLGKIAWWLKAWKSFLLSFYQKWPCSHLEVLHVLEHSGHKWASGSSACIPEDNSVITDAVSGDSSKESDYQR